MNFRERYLVKREARQAAAAWTYPAASRLGLLSYQQRNVIRVEASENLFVNSSAAGSPVREAFILSFNFSPLGFEGGDDYLRHIEFSVDGNRSGWQASESAGEPPVSLEDLLISASPAIKAKAGKTRIFFEMYEGIYSRLFPVVTHGDLHTDLGAYEE
jgi:hypothetical protein